LLQEPNSVTSQNTTFFEEFLDRRLYLKQGVTICRPVWLMHANIDSVVNTVWNLWTRKPTRNSLTNWSTNSFSPRTVVQGTG
jgi:hypothetical protein